MVPFYLSWDPTSSRIAYLGAPSDTFIELGVLEAAGRSSGRRSTPANPCSSPGGRTAIGCWSTSARNGSTGSASTVRRARSATGRGPSRCRCGPPMGRPSCTRRRTGTGSVSSPRNVKADEGTATGPLRRPDRVRREPGRRAGRVPGARARAHTPALGHRRRQPARSSRSSTPRSRRSSGAPTASACCYLDPDPLPDDTGLWFRWGCGTGRPRSSRRASP